LRRHRNPRRRAREPRRERRLDNAVALEESAAHHSSRDLRRNTAANAARSFGHCTLSLRSDSIAIPASFLLLADQLIE
jgi:hypothetical protein